MLGNEFKIVLIYAVSVNNHLYFLDARPCFFPSFISFSVTELNKFIINILYTSFFFPFIK